MIEIFISIPAILQIQTFSTAGSGITQSTDGGQNWNYYNNGLPYSDVACVTSSKSNSYRLFASTYGGGIYKVTKQ